jgi:hypothetical protein
MNQLPAIVFAPVDRSDAHGELTHFCEANQLCLGPLDIAVKPKSGLGNVVMFSNPVASPSR